MTLFALNMILSFTSSTVAYVKWVRNKCLAFGDQSKCDITESLSSSFSDDDDTAEGVHCCGVQRCVKTGVVATIVGRSSTRVIAARGRLKKHESGARPAEASLIDGECRVIARSALLHAA